LYEAEAKVKKLGEILEKLEKKQNMVNGEIKEFKDELEPIFFENKGDIEN
jgi:hypothetical protein